MISHLFYVIVGPVPKPIEKFVAPEELEVPDDMEIVRLV